MQPEMPTELHVKVRLEDNSFWATVDEYPGVFAAGDSLDELRESLEEAIALYLAGPDEQLRPVNLVGFELQAPGEVPATAALEYA